MPIIRIDLLKGRSVEQKQQMAKEITKTVSKIAKTKEENIKIIFSDMEFENYASGGKLAKESNNEQK